MDGLPVEEEFQAIQPLSLEAPSDLVLEVLLKAGRSAVGDPVQEMVATQLIKESDVVKAIRQALIYDPLSAPCVIICSVPAYQNAAGQNLPIRWGEERLARLTMLETARLHGLTGYFKLIFPNFHAVSKITDLARVEKNWIPMSAIFVGFRIQGKLGLSYDQMKYLQDKDNLEYYSSGL